MCGGGRGSPLYTSLNCKSQVSQYVPTVGTKKLNPVELYAWLLGQGVDEEDATKLKGNFCMRSINDALTIYD